MFATHQRRQKGLQAPSATDGQDTVPVSVEAALPAQRHRASFTQVPSRFRARLPRPSPTGLLARTDPGPQFLHRPMRCDIGLPSPVI